MRNFLAAWLVLAVVLIAGAIAFAASGTKAVTKVVVGRSASRSETIYITNYSPRYWSDAEVKNDIPAWERALNVDFAGYWHTTQYRLVYLGRKPAPKGQMSAVIQSKGPINGALAYHWIERNDAPSITVYAGTGAYYGFNNSVSMTHELFELAADPLTSYVSQGYPALFYWVETPDMQLHPVQQLGVLGWFNETADPVEADYYLASGANGKPVEISDFVTPAWFNDGIGTRYDFMGLCQQPFWIRPGGYAQYLDAGGWNMVTNFRRGHPADRGFVKSDPDPSSRA